MLHPQNYGVPPKQTSPWKVLAIVMGVLVLVCGGLALLGGYVGMQLTKEPPKARVGTGHPVALGKVADGWTHYRLPEVPMTLDLPLRPVAESLEFDKISSLLYTDWIRYTVDAEFTTLAISAYWFRSRSMLDLDDEAEEAKTEFGAESKLKALKTTIQDRTIGDHSGKEIVAEYSVDGVEGETRLFYFSHEKGVFCIEAHAAKSLHDSLVADYERLVESIAFE
jgi:hypothetical protein